jgi:hypothetical protein
MIDQPESIEDRTKEILPDGSQREQFIRLMGQLQIRR